MPERQLTLAQEVTRVADEDSLLLDEEDLKVLGLDDPNAPLTELDWKGLYNTFCHLRSIAPRPDPIAFTKGANLEGRIRRMTHTPLPRARC